MSNMKRKHKTVISTVTFRANIPMVGRFEHAHIEAGADVAPGDDPQRVLDDLKTFVASELKRAKEGDVKQPVMVPGRFRV